VRRFFEAFGEDEEASVSSSLSSTEMEWKDLLRDEGAMVGVAIVIMGRREGGMISSS
jgi:hypothetical protein